MRQYYQEVMNNCCVDLLSELCAFGVTYSDALGFVEDAFGIKAMQSIIQDFQSTHPLLRYQVVSVSCSVSLQVLLPECCCHGYCCCVAAG